MTTVTLLLTLTALAALGGLLALVVRTLLRRPKEPVGYVYSHYQRRDLPPDQQQVCEAYDRVRYRRSDWRKALLVGWIASWVLGILFFISIPLCGQYLAGQGDALDEAKRWTERWVPGGTVECQTRDTDDNNFVTCTVGAPNGDLTAIECGVNRWYQGWQVSDCRLMKGFSGRQP